uniref:Syntaxin 8 n=1 Tax=Cricetulus griseus TaxID=10029 RepID=A0A8C2N1N0_CRIGR
MAPDPWFSTYDSTCQIAQEIAEKIQQRNQCERRGEKTPKLTLTIRTLLKNLKVKIDTLKDLLLRAVSTRQMYPCKHVHLPSRRNLGHPDFSTPQGGLGLHTVA